MYARRARMQRCWNKKCSITLTPLEISAFSLAGGKLKNKSKVKKQNEAQVSRKVVPLLFDKTQSLTLKFCIKVNFAKLTLIKAATPKLNL